jgi:hypothetical protein
MLLFSPFPQTLEIDEADSHISTATTTTRMNLILKNRPLRDTQSGGKVTIAEEAPNSSRN